MHQFVSPIKILSGEGVLKNIPQELQNFNAGNVMIFADPGIIQAGILSKLEDVLKDAKVSYSIFSDLVPEPPLETGREAVQALKESNADFVIGIGGGSSLDVAKAAAVLYGNEGEPGDFLNLTGSRELENKGLPKMLIPTTSGTGAEVTDISVFSLEKTKDVITDPLLLADVAVLDPELTYTVPPRITASTGVDALTHAVEAYISVNATPLTDSLALEAVRLISRNIRTAVWHGSHEESRNKMAWGSLLAGLSFYNAGVSGVHALAYPLGGLYKIPHGESNAVMLPYVFDFVWPSCMEKMTDLADALGVDASLLSTREAAVSAVQALQEIVRDTGIPQTLDRFGVKEEDIPLLAEEGIKQKRLLQRSPRPYSQNDIFQVYQAAYFGELSLGK
ncbi:iron-containing alcohol dehydrogenase [Thalassobacillus sp. C254]|uniref:iron-containing alcohol dehydrogenase n=1 Tax=Thalassobacillus sp. C254 TaxID=1225341 RepID=UPI0006D131A6|nr:iron-containing alcohol dehydrogenase [Thalassobacillus sp. C254]